MEILGKVVLEMIEFSSQEQEIADSVDRSDRRYVCGQTSYLAVRLDDVVLVFGFGLFLWISMDSSCF